jgi:hypothetical protein
MGSVRRWQRLRRHALDLAMAIRVNDVALEHHFDGYATARFVRSERCGSLHDLRRTMATDMGELGVQPHCAAIPAHHQQ